MISAEKSQLLSQKLTFANEFKSHICKLVNMLKAKRPKDQDIKVLGERILTVHAINEFEIIERAGPIVLKYKDLLTKVDEITDVEKFFWSTEESKLAKKVDDQEQFQNILKCVAEEAKTLKPKEKEEVVNVGKKLIETYLQYLLIEKKLFG